MTNFFKGSAQGIVDATYSNKYTKTTVKLKPEQFDGEMTIIGYTAKAAPSQHLHDSSLHYRQQMICD